MTALYSVLTGCGLPCFRGDRLPHRPRLPCLTWTADLTAPGSGTLTLTCWYREDDTALLDMLDRLAVLFPAGGRVLRDAEKQPIQVLPAQVKCVADPADGSVRGGRMVLRWFTWPGLEVRP